LYSSNVLHSSVLDLAEKLGSALCVRRLCLPFAFLPVGRQLGTYRRAARLSPVYNVALLDISELASRHISETALITSPSIQKMGRPRRGSPDFEHAMKESSGDARGYTGHCSYRCSMSCGEEAERMFDLYNNAYGNYASDPYRHVRIETYGQDFGQTSGVTTEESLEIPQLLDLGPDSSVLEVGCGSGGYALHLAENLGCQIVGLDINEPGIRSAKELARTRALDSRARFEQCDVSKNLPF